MPICWICGKRLISAGTRKPVAGVPIKVDAHEVRAHKKCAISQGYSVPPRRKTVTRFSEYTAIRGPLLFIANQPNKDQP